VITDMQRERKTKRSQREGEMKVRERGEEEGE
jgi:hypothetical protein